jgi:hypothetical protein
MLPSVDLKISLSSYEEKVDSMIWDDVHICRRMGETTGV